jgi:hypothetical protein
MMKRLRDGLWNGIPPYGYRLVDGKLEQEPEEAQRVREVFTWYLSRNMGAVSISRELNAQGLKPRKGDRWKATRVLKMLSNPLYTGVVRWGGETVQGMHEAIVSQETFDAAQKTMRARRDNGTRSARSPNVLTGLVRCGTCGAPMHVTYPGDSAKSQYRYYVCNNRLNHQSCGQDYIRADVLEQSLLVEMGKLSAKEDVVSGLVREFTTGRMAQLPDLETRREVARKELVRVQKEREKLTRWVLSSTPTPQGMGYLNSEVDRLAEAEGVAQERLWTLEDQINGLELATYNAQGVCNRMAAVVQEFPKLDAGERRLWAQCWIEDVTVKNKEVVAILTPPLPGLGFTTTEPAPKGRRPQVPELRIRLEYSLSAYYHAGACGGVDGEAPAPETRYSLAPESESMPSDADGFEGQAPGNGRSRKCGATLSIQ